MSLWLISAECVRGAGNLWIIFFSIVWLLVPFEMLSLVVLGRLELYLDKW